MSLACWYPPSKDKPTAGFNFLIVFTLQLTKTAHQNRSRHVKKEKQTAGTGSFSRAKGADGTRAPRRREPLRSAAGEPLRIVATKPHTCSAAEPLRIAAAEPHPCEAEAAEPLCIAAAEPLPRAAAMLLPCE
jgi:hypothetical protein